MGVYQRDNIQYNNMIDAAIRNRLEGAKVRSDAQRKQGEIWGGAVKNLGNMAARYMDYANANKESPEARLEALEKELRQAEIEKKYNEQVAQRRAVQDYIDNYNYNNKRDSFIAQAIANAQGQRPNMAGYGVYQDANSINPLMLQQIEEEYRRGI